MNAPNTFPSISGSVRAKPQATAEARLSLEGISDRAEYIRTPDAAAFLGAVAEAGLTLSEDAVKELTSEQDWRYGNAYAWLTRSAAAWISSGREVHSGISIFKREGVWSDEQNDILQPDPTDTSQLAFTGHQGADLLIHLLHQTSEAQKTGNTISDIPVTKNVTSMKRNGCKDVEVYFLEATSGKYGPDSIETVKIGEKSFWKKHEGAETFINLEQVLYNGVSLPPGCVFRKEDDEGFLFLRVTGLAFDQATAESLFGSAISSWHEMVGGSAELERLFTAFQWQRDKVAEKSAKVA